MASIVIIPLYVFTQGGHIFIDDLPTVGEHWPGTGKLEAKETMVPAHGRVRRHTLPSRKQAVNV